MVNSAVEAIADGFETVERRTLQEQIYRQLRQGIMSGRFRPGQSLSTRAVAEAVGVSVMPVRDALRRLEVENALVVGHNRMLQVPRLDAETLGEISAMRVALEGLAVERAVDSIAPDAIDRLGTLCRTMEEGVCEEDADAYLDANWAFHSLLYRSGAGAILLSAIEGLWLRMGPYFRLFAAERKHLDTAMRCHRAIVDALRCKDEAAARRAVVADIEAAAGDLAQWLAAEKAQSAHNV